MILYIFKYTLRKYSIIIKIYYKNYSIDKLNFVLIYKNCKKQSLLFSSQFFHKLILLTFQKVSLLIDSLFSKRLFYFKKYSLSIFCSERIIIQ